MVLALTKRHSSQVHSNNGQQTPAVPATEDSPEIPAKTSVETVLNMTPENKAHYESEKEAIHLILTGIGDEIYSTVDACQTAQEMWEAIERLQQGESLNIQDVKTNLFWEFGQFTSHDGETIESYYTRFYKMMNEMIRKFHLQRMQFNLQEYQRQRDSNQSESYHPLSQLLKKTVILNNSERTKKCKKKWLTLQSIASDWLADTDRKLKNEQDSGITITGYMAKITRVETGDSNVIPDSPDMCDNDIQNDQHDVDCDDERVALANLIANLKLDVDDNKKIQKQLKKANATLTQELTECKSILAETSRTLGESNSIRDSCLVALQNKQTEFEKYKAFNDRTVDYDKLERKLNETLGLLAQKDIDIQEGLKVKAYEISVVQAKHDELVKQSLLTRSHYEGLVKEKTKVITDLKLREDKDIDKMISMEHQIKFLNEIVYKRGQSIQTIQMLAPKCSTFNGRPTFANPMYHKKAQSGPATRLIPDSEEILTLADASRSKLNKDLVKPFDYTKLNSLYEIFKPPAQHYEIVI
ncbi:hypothetical protein Tco_0988807 [Tanacetum coccineum]|uniref:Uncharacterized protein n=1 Tax=Tanacetum coccineum TaxID=301880 RepID=A0ABQ5ESF9_9ASTR